MTTKTKQAVKTTATKAPEVKAAKAKEVKATGITINEVPVKKAPVVKPTAQLKSTVIKAPALEDIKFNTVVTATTTKPTVSNKPKTVSKVTLPRSKAADFIVKAAVDAFSPKTNTKPIPVAKPKATKEVSPFKTVIKTPAVKEVKVKHTSPLTKAEKAESVKITKMMNDNIDAGNPPGVLTSAGNFTISKNVPSLGQDRPSLADLFKTGILRS